VTYESHNEDVNINSRCPFPYMTGWLYDVTGSYDPGFNLAGMLVSLSGLMLFVIPYMETKPYNYSLATVTVTSVGHEDMNDMTKSNRIKNNRRLNHENDKKLLY